MKCSSINQQRGSSLVEAVIALALIAIITNGAIYLTSRATASQGEARLQEIALTQMRNAVINQSTICDTAPTGPAVTLPYGGTVQTVVQGCGATVTATIDASPANPNIPQAIINNIQAPIKIGANDPRMGGVMIVGGTWTGTLPTAPVTTGP